MLSFLPIARRPIALTAYRRGSRGYGVLHAAPPRQYPGPGPITSSLMSIAGAAIVTWVGRSMSIHFICFLRLEQTFYKVIWDYTPTAKAVEPQVSDEGFLSDALRRCILAPTATHASCENTSADMYLVLEQSSC